MEQTRSAGAKIKTRTLHLEDVYIVSLLWGKKNISSQACAKKADKVGQSQRRSVAKGGRQGRSEKMGVG